MGGEKISFFFTGCSPRGSPPRGRGKGFSMMRTSTFTMDHPRVGGEKMEIMLDVWTYQGSPPHRRGKVRKCADRSCSRRITPARAGKSAPRGTPGRNHQDHPRVGGEKLGLGFFLACQPGSPPRGRGKEGPLWGASIPVRITPAWAGKSRTFQVPADSCGDHPRVGGEKERKICQR